MLLEENVSRCPNISQAPFSVSLITHKYPHSAYNDMCYLIEKYAPIDGIGQYDPLIDPSLTGARITPHLSEGLI